MLKPQELGKVDYFIVDGLYMVNRSYYSTPMHLTDGKGLVTNAIHGFFSSVVRACKDLKPANVIIALDSLTKTYREVSFSEYKGERAAFPDPLVAQIPHIMELAACLGFAVIECPGYEADDVIASCKQLQGTKVIITTDKDIHSLVDATTFIYQRKAGKSQILTAEDIKLTWGVEPKQILDVLALMGDSIDNIPGVKGIGRKSAVELVSKWGSIEQMLLNTDKLPSKLNSLLVLYAKELQLSRELVALNGTLDIKPIFDKRLGLAEQKFKELNVITAAKQCLSIFS